MPPGVLSFACSVLAGITLSVCCVTAIANSPEPANGKILSDVIPLGSVERQFSYFQPTKPPGGKIPVVLYLHGYGDNSRHMLGKGIVAAPSAIWMQVAEREDFLVLYPLGTKGNGRKAKRGWNDCRQFQSGNSQTDDEAFLGKLMDYAITNLNADPARIYVTGKSNGGHMSMRIAMQMSERVAAAASVVSLLPVEHGCSPPALPVPILFMHGTNDKLAPYTGGKMPGGRGQVLSARDTVKQWLLWNKLSNASEQVANLPDSEPGDGSTAIRRSWQHPTQPINVVAYELVNAGHTEPSRTARLGRLMKRVLGNQNQDIEMADEIWSFFKGHTR